MRIRMVTGWCAAVALSTATALAGISATPLTASAAGVGPSGVSTAPVSSWWGTNGRVSDTKLVGSRVYLAGAFDYVGPQSGYGAPVSTSTGTISAVAPRVDGVVRASAPDGAGGWYIAGDFTTIGDSFRRGAAQIDATGAVTRWDPRPLGSVYAIAVLADKVILGGELTGIGSTDAPVQRLAAVDRDTGAALAGWHASANGTVRSLAAGGGAVFAGGDFTGVNGSYVSHVGRLTADTGRVDTGFSGSVYGGVNALALSADGSTLYAGGAFGAVTSAGLVLARANLAAFATNSGVVVNWAPRANALVAALGVDQTSGIVYVGGQFTSLAGVARGYLGSVTGTGAPTAFNPALSGCNAPHRTKNTYTLVPCMPEVDALGVQDGVVYVGGRFGQSGTTERHNAAAFSAGSSTPNSWNPVPSGQILALAPAGPSTFVGGDLTSMNGLVRKGLAALDAATGAGDATFRVDANDIVLDLELSPDRTRLYVMGSFTRLGGLNRANIAALTTATGRVDTGFVAQANNSALIGKAFGGALYVGGTFARVNNVIRSHLVKLNGATGGVDPLFVVNTSGDAGPLQRGGMVQGLAVRRDGSRVYLAGPFTSANGVAVKGGLLVVDGTRGARTTSQLGGVEACPQLGPWVTHIDLSADERYLYGGDTCPDFVYKWDAVRLGTPTNPTGLTWITWCNGGMQALVEVNGRLYYGSHGGDRNAGGFCWRTPTDHTRLERQRLIVFDATSGDLTTDQFFFDSPMGVWSLEVLPQGLLVGGDFTLVGDRNTVHQGLALLPGTP